MHSPSHVARSLVPEFEALMQRRSHSHFRDGGMFRLDDRLLTAMAEHAPSVLLTEPGDAAALQKLLLTPMREL